MFYFLLVLVHFIAGVFLFRHHFGGFSDSSGVGFPLTPVEFGNATAIFNTIQLSLKDKDSSLHPVGVSFIPAYVPPNTPLFHATGSPHVPLDLEWIAFDSEFSYNFAHVTARVKQESEIEASANSEHSEAFENSEFFRPPPPWHRPGGPGGPGRGPSGEGSSFMYTFINPQPLDKLVYLDGSSAAKTSTGEMDQQLVLSRQADPSARVNEREAARKICQWGRPFGLQGVVRVEVGFEAIICDFQRDLKLVSNVTVGPLRETVGFPANSTQFSKDFLSHADKVSALDWIAGGERTSLNGDRRILLDFANMVTPLNRTYIDPNPYHRRINLLDEKIKDQLVNDVKNTLKTPTDPFKKTDWGQITSHIVEKFGPMLMQLNSTLAVFSRLKNIESTAQNLTSVTFNFVRRYGTNRTAAFDASINDYVYNTFPVTTETEALIQSSILTVYTAIFNVLYDSFETTSQILRDLNEQKDSDHTSALFDLQSSLSPFLDLLYWSIFTRCTQQCGFGEICYTPTFGPGPFGWGDSATSWFSYDGERYVIPQDLKCIGIDDLLRAEGH